MIRKPMTILLWLALAGSMINPAPSAAATQAVKPAAAPEKPALVLLLARFDQPHRDLVAMTLGWMCRKAGVEFDLYYAADHKEGGLFAPHGSPLVGGQHALRIGRALAAFRTTVVRLGGVSVFDTLVRQGAEIVIDAPENLADFYLAMTKTLNLPLPREAVVFGRDDVPLAALFPEAVYRKALALPIDLSTVEIARLKQAGLTTIWTVAKPGADLSAWRDSGLAIKTAIAPDVADPAHYVASRWIAKAQAVDTLEPNVASYLLPLSIREDRLMLTYVKREEGVKRRDQMLELMKDKPQDYALGRWYGDPQLLPLAGRPMAYNVVEPNRQILTVFARHPVALPQPARSWLDLEPSDDQLRAWAREGKILAAWVLHSGELSHDDAVLTFYDWSSMTKVKIGSGVHWQRYHYDPDAVEPMHTPVDEGGVLGLVEPVLHSTGAGIIWETAGDPQAIVRLMTDSRRKIAQVAGERFAPRGVYCFGDHHAQPKGAGTPGGAQLAFWKAVKAAGFEYLITSILPGDSRILYRDGDFVVLNQAAKVEWASPFVRGTPETFVATERKLAAAGKPGWLIGALDSPIHGSPIYVGRPYGGKKPHPRISDFYDYVQQGGATGKVVSATPRTIARYARMVADMEKTRGESPK